MSFVMKELKDGSVSIVPSGDRTVEYGCVGGKINSRTLQSMIKNGYSDKPKDIKNIDGYVLDSGLSGTRAQVFHNPETNHLVVNHRGTKGLHDVMTDIGLMLGHKNNERFKHGKKITDEALGKYDTDNVTITGHSLSGNIVRQNNNNDKHDIVVVNPAVTPYDLFKKQKKNETIIRSTFDPVSALHTWSPFASSKNTINIKAKSYSPLSEHSSDILERLDGADVGV